MTAKRGDMDSIIEALEKIEEMLLQQQAQINQLTTDINTLAKLLQAVTKTVTQMQQKGSEDEPS
jgi:predicted DNA-binding ArsR family transcriptional regulator